MKSIFIFLSFVFISLFVEADVYQYRYNAQTGKQDLVTVIAPNVTPGATYSGFTFDGTNWCLYVNGVSKECWTQVLTTTVNYALLQTTEVAYILTEDGNKFILEH